ncbi:uncharacterized protein BYT42DRAFT_586980 [Radiomyces spectabilis]|uniref:uncharacterized protein n=1 Tax=Radiomyces spectabilis TaxID=64574 RepID=UPI00221F827F|nr:uncharacterized protein BYT42DRAFT_586980 [Radiomyces spectabilis]KAI8367648.1 hypothetical protein BYT42DRAFT_586980 [Radiomyces spectabilis]
MNEQFPSGWFYIQSSTHHHQCLTAVTLSVEKEARIELRPFLAKDPRQLWTYDDGFLVNKYSAYVMSVKNAGRKNECIFQQKRFSDNTKKTVSEAKERRHWEYANGALYLKAYPGFCMSEQDVPRLVEREENYGWRCISVLTQTMRDISLDDRTA